jgi:hypothetical protein
MNINALKAYLAFLPADQGGGIDYKGSATNLIADLQAYEAVLEATGGKVKDAILSVFAKYKGANLNKDALISFTMQELAAGPENYSVYADAINTFLKPLDKGGNVGERETGALCGMRKGIGGGFWLWADKPETPAAK